MSYLILLNLAHVAFAQPIVTTTFLPLDDQTTIPRFRCGEPHHESIIEFMAFPERFEEDVGKIFAENARKRNIKIEVKEDPPAGMIYSYETDYGIVVLYDFTDPGYGAWLKTIRLVPDDMTTNLDQYVDDFIYCQAQLGSWKP